MTPNHPPRVQTTAASASNEGVPAEKNAGYASPEEGLRSLLAAEGGCVDFVAAHAMFARGQSSPAAPDAFLESIREGGVISFKHPSGEIVFPVWQFGPAGLLPNLGRVLAAIREQIPGYDQLAPFAFFLQTDTILGGRTPLETLKAGDVDRVLRAVAGHLG